MSMNANRTDQQMSTATQGQKGRCALMSEIIDIAWYYRSSLIYIKRQGQLRITKNIKTSWKCIRFYCTYRHRFGCNDINTNFATWNPLVEQHQFVDNIIVIIKILSIFNKPFYPYYYTKYSYAILTFLFCHQNNRFSIQTSYVNTMLKLGK